MSHLQSVRQEEDSKVAVEGVGMLPEGAWVEGLHGRHLNTAPPHEARLGQQRMGSSQYLHLHHSYQTFSFPLSFGCAASL